MTDPIDRAISTLNSLAIGDMEKIRRRLLEVRSSLEAMGKEELVGLLDEAREALSEADVPLFRRRVQNVVSRLGHLR